MAITIVVVIIDAVNCLTYGLDLEPGVTYEIRGVAQRDTEDWFIPATVDGYAKDLNLFQRLDAWIVSFMRRRREYPMYSLLGEVYKKEDLEELFAGFSLDSHNLNSKDALTSSDMKILLVKSPLLAFQVSNSENHRVRQGMDEEELECKVSSNSCNTFKLPEDVTEARTLFFSVNDFPCAYSNNKGSYSVTIGRFKGE